MKLYNCLGQNACSIDFYVYKHLGVLFPNVNSYDNNICYTRLLITTINFEWTNHWDNMDLVSGNVKDDLLCKLKVVVNDKDVQGFLQSTAESSIEFLLVGMYLFLPLLLSNFC